MTIRHSALLALALSGSIALAQGPRNPRGKATADVHGKTITIDYGRPALKGRKFEDMLKQLQADRMWRAGENQVTTLDTPLDLMIGDAKVPAGKYSLYVHFPATGDASLVVNRDLGIELVKIYPPAPAAVAHALWPRLDGYDKIADKEAARVKLRASTETEPVDPLTITMKPSGGGGLLTIAWGDRSWSVSMKPAA
jgi:hypothetical protein